MSERLRDNPERMNRAVRYLYRKVSPYRETSMQLAKLVELFGRMRPEDVADVIEDLYRRAAWGHYQYKLLFNCLFRMETIIERLGSARMSEMYSYARNMPTRVVERLMIAPENRIEIDLDPNPELDEITLGEKKQFAKEFDHNMLEKLLRDNHPHVISNLLRNPRVVEKHVLRIATRRPAPPEVLIEITNHPRWFQRTTIKEALLRNPYTPFAVSLNLVPFFTRVEITKMERDPGLHGEIRDTISEILELKDLYGETDDRATAAEQPEQDVPSPDETPPDETTSPEDESPEGPS